MAAATQFAEQPAASPGSGFKPDVTDPLKGAEQVTRFLQNNQALLNKKKKAAPKPAETLGTPASEDSPRQSSGQAGQAGEKDVDETVPAGQGAGRGDSRPSDTASRDARRTQDFERRLHDHWAARAAGEIRASDERHQESDGAKREAVSQWGASSLNRWAGKHGFQGRRASPPDRFGSG